MAAQAGGVLRQINKYLLQAKKLDAVDPLIGYYCRFYAAQRALKLKRTPMDLSVVNELISWCEAHKGTIGGVSKDEARTRLETFALQVFEGADTEDRDDRANHSTAAAFYTAFVLMDVCRQFGDLASDIEQKVKYAAWRAAEITRALKEGRRPTPPESNNSLDELHLNGSDIGDASGSGASMQSHSQSRSQSTAGALSAGSPAALPASYPPASLPPSFDLDSPPPLPPLPSAYNPAAFGPTGVENQIDHRFTVSQASAALTPQTPSLQPQSQQPTPQRPSAAPAPAQQLSYSSPAPSRLTPSPSPPSSAYRTRTEAAREVERQIKHALSALNFDDFETCHVKLTTALQALDQHRR